MPAYSFTGLGIDVMNFRSVDVQKNCIIAIVVFVVINYHCILVMWICRSVYSDVSGIVLMGSNKYPV